MGFRLLTAVRALLADPRLADRKDVVRLGALVLMAKASHGSCRVEITARELGRWLGVSESTVDHEVLNVLRDVDAVAARVLRGADGLPTGVEYRVEALWEARNDVGAPLALSKAELATLLRFLEELFAPGWGEQCATPPGLLVKKGRRGRGAASDRLALVLLALHARPDGRVPLVGGPLAKTVARHGRAAVTLARMLGCHVPVAARVLGRLVAAEAVMVSQGRLVVPAVAAAHGSAAAVPDAAELKSPASADPASAGDASRCVRCAGREEDVLVVEGDGWRQLSWDDLAGAEEGSGTAPRDLDEADSDLFAGQAVFETFEGSRAAADPHAEHAVVADVRGEGAGGLGFSGEAASGYCRQPVRACEGENSPALEDGIRGDVTVVDGEASPLRGEKPDLLLAKGESGSPAAASTLRAWRDASGGPPPVWAQVPRGLERVLEPVAMMWGRLDRLTTRRYVTKVVHARLGEISGACGPGVDAERILRERLKRRLAEQGTVPVTDPVGWLVGRALPRRAVCPDGRCDDGRRMDTRADCAACQMLVLDGRALRSRAFVKATTALGGGRVDRTVFEAELNACWQREASAAAVRREKAVQERTARERVWAEQRAQRAAQEAAQQALACTVCGTPKTAGLCGRCRDEHRVEELVAEAIDVAVATWGMGSGAYRLDAVRRTEQDMRGAVDQAVTDLLAAGGGVFAESVALAARLAAELQLGALRRRAVNRFAYQPPAQAEYEKAFATEMRRSHLHNSVDEAREAAEEAAQTARFNTAHALLDDRLRTLRAARPAAEADAEPDWYAQAAAQVRGLIHPAPPERAVPVRRPPALPGSPAGGSEALAGVGA
ncbi:hypothetical protein [Streptomyces sp. TRM75561]|uniref:hypothetical protein n=1 Tax=Streptomyces sp. TRM75561 TaxID=2975269 RepID=UPI00244AC917|nr:hypothetical protein [Streptomyces sp. TRM75561]MDH3039197.1 hypothetical protein [Streptomyces sp. TRM75561]